MDRAIVILSGGLDSTVALAKVIAERDYHVVAGVFFSYGQKAEQQEFMAAQQVVAHYLETGDLGIEFTLQEVPLSMISIVDSSLLKDSNTDVPKNRSLVEIVPEPTIFKQKGVTTFERRKSVPKPPPSTFVPGRNIYMLTAAAVIARASDAHILVGGWHWQDSSGYPDCTHIFLRHMQLALSSGLDHRIHVSRPLITLSKSDIVTLAHDLDVPHHVTWSCYDPWWAGNVMYADPRGWMHCGRCDSCTLRRTAFEKASVLDHTRYAKDLTCRL